MRSTCTHRLSSSLASYLLLVASWLGGAHAVHAQGPRPEAVAGASAAFREGQAAQLAGDYARAAEMFELADDTAPSGAALRSAIRNRQAAGHNARAASLAAEAILRYPEDAETRALADQTIAALAPTLGHLVIRCEPACTASVDGRAAHEHASALVELYVDPGAHSVVASWAGRDPVSESVEVAPGATEERSMTAPEVAVAEPEPVDEPEPVTQPAPVTEPAPSSGVSPIVFGSLVGLTLISGGVLIWSGIDVMQARDAYVLAPTRAGYDDGVSRELRTNVLIGVTAALGLGSLIVAFFTDFGGSAASSDTVGSDTAGIDSFMLVPLDGGAALSIAGHL